MASADRPLTLYATPLSANARKALAVLHHLGLDVQIEHVDVYRGEGRRPAYLAIVPSGKIPALVDGDFVLTESNAIIQYMAETYGDFRLSSRDPKRRADIARWLFWEAAHWQPAFVSVLAPAVGHLLMPTRSPHPTVPCVGTTGRCARRSACSTPISPRAASSTAASSASPTSRSPA